MKLPGARIEQLRPGVYQCVECGDVWSTVRGTQGWWRYPSGCNHDVEDDPLG
jgi:hypothetical protein